MTESIKTMPESIKSIYGREAHLKLVIDILDSPHTSYYQKWNLYKTLWFAVHDPQGDYGDLQDTSKSDFTDKVLIAAAKYLERSESFDQVED